MKNHFNFYSQVMEDSRNLVFNEQREFFHSISIIKLQLVLLFVVWEKSLFLFLDVNDRILNLVDFGFRRVYFLEQSPVQFINSQVVVECQIHNAWSIRCDQPSLGQGHALEVFETEVVVQSLNLSKEIVFLSQLLNCYTQVLVQLSQFWVLRGSEHWNSLLHLLCDQIFLEKSLSALLNIVFHHRNKSEDFFILFKKFKSFFLLIRNMSENLFYLFRWFDFIF